MSKKTQYAPPALFFSAPYIAGQQYAPGIQINSPGESAMLGAQPGFAVNPWPVLVPSLVALANNSGTPHMRGGQPTINRYATAGANSLFISGVAEKSLG